jgi:hypothetical protein
MGIGRVDLWSIGVVSGLPRVLNIRNKATVGISHPIVDSLDTAIRQSNRVGARCGLASPLLASIEVGSRVAISHTIVVRIRSRLLIVGSGSSVDRRCTRGCSQCKEESNRLHHVGAGWNQLMTPALINPTFIVILIIS